MKIKKEAKAYRLEGCICMSCLTGKPDLI